MATQIPIPEGWRDHITTEERDITNRWAMFGSDCIVKVGRLWDSGVPQAPLFKTKKSANEFLSSFVCDAIPLRCLERMKQ